MTKDELKRYVCGYLDSQAENLIRSGEELLHIPELSYRENKTSAFVGNVFDRLGLRQKTGLAITGRRADIDTGRPGPRMAILGELDALIVPHHPFANPETHAAHACGHHAALNAMLGCAEVLTKPEVLQHLSGSLAFIATPSEECQDQPYIASLIEQGKLQFFGGKSEMIAEGVFDDIDLAEMVHAGDINCTVSGFNGFVMKHLLFHGKSAHAGENPEKGVNAISMMRGALDLLDAQRDTFRDEDHVRVHGYIPDGGKAVNVVPDYAAFTMQVRAAAPEAIRDASLKIDRCVQAAAIAFGGKAEARNVFGFMPLIAYSMLDELHLENLQEFIAPGAPLTKGVYRPSSTDMGDVSMLIPSIHPYFRGFSGTAHTDNFLVSDPHQAYVDSAKMLALMAVDLLWGNAETGKAAAAAKCPMNKAEYIQGMRDFSSSKLFDGTDGRF